MVLFIQSPINLGTVLCCAGVLYMACSSGSGENGNGSPSENDAGSGGTGAGDGDGDGAGDGDGDGDGDGHVGTGSTGSGTGATSGASGGSSGTGGDTSMTPPAANFPLLVVAGGSTLQVWENADELIDDDAADFELSVSGSIFEVVASRQRLGVISTDGVFLFDDLGTLNASSVPAHTIPSEVFGAELSGYFHDSVIDSEGDLWVTYDPGRAALLKGFDSLTSSSKPSAEFVHEWDQLVSVSYHAKEDVLFGMQVSGAGVQIYEGAKSKTGEVSPDGALDDHSGWGSVMLDDSLYVGGNEFAFWHDVSATGAPSAPTGTLSESGLFIDAAANAVVLLDKGADEPLRYYASADALSAGSHPETLGLLEGTKALDLSADGKWVAVLGEEVYLVDHESSGLTLRATLPLESEGNVLTLVE